MFQRRAWQHDDMGTVVPLYQVPGGLQSLTSTGMQWSVTKVVSDSTSAGCVLTDQSVRCAGLTDVYGAKEGSDGSSHSGLLIGTSFTLPGDALVQND